MKTHKTAQGAMIQLDPARFGLGKEVEVEGKVEDELTGKLIVSTVAEGWGILNDVISKDESIVKDVSRQDLKYLNVTPLACKLIH